MEHIAVTQSPPPRLTLKLPEEFNDRCLAFSGLDEGGERPLRSSLSSSSYSRLYWPGIICPGFSDEAYSVLL